MINDCDADGGRALDPRENPELVGQEAAEAVLNDAFISGRLAHAWIFGGPQGVGKATLAFRLARYLFSHGGEAKELGLFTTGNPSLAPSSLFIEPDDPIFKRVASGGHADLLTVERGYDENRNRQRSEITVDEARKVSAFLNHTAAEGGWRVVIVDGVENMNPNAANALLKVLEEPPPQALLILVSHRPDQLLPTIRSRCRYLRLPPLNSDVLQHFLEQMQPELSSEDLQTIIELSRGSIGRAMGVVGGGALALRRDISTLLDGLPNLDVAALHQLTDKIGRDSAGDLFGTAQEIISEWLNEIVRQRSIAKAGSLDHWFEVWEKTQQLMRRGDSLNLDRKQLILNIFSLIEDATR